MPIAVPIPISVSVARAVRVRVRGINGVGWHISNVLSTIVAVVGGRVDCGQAVTLEIKK